MLTPCHMQKHDLHPVGVKNICSQILIHVLRDFECHKKHHRGNMQTRLNAVHREYMSRVIFIARSPLVVHVADVMEYDVDKVRNNMIKIVDEKYERTCNYYRKLMGNRSYL